MECWARPGFAESEGLGGCKGHKGAKEGKWKNSKNRPDRPITVYVLTAPYSTLCMMMNDESRTSPRRGGGCQRLKRTRFFWERRFKAFKFVQAGDDRWLRWRVHVAKALLLGTYGRRIMLHYVRDSASRLKLHSFPVNATFWALLPYPSTMTNPDLVKCQGKKRLLFGP